MENSILTYIKRTNFESLSGVFEEVMWCKLRIGNNRIFFWTILNLLKGGAMNVKSNKGGKFSIENSKILGRRIEC